MRYRIKENLGTYPLPVRLALVPVDGDALVLRKSKPFLGPSHHPTEPKRWLSVETPHSLIARRKSDA